MSPETFILPKKCHSPLMEILNDNSESQKCHKFSMFQLWILKFFSFKQKAIFVINNTAFIWIVCVKLAVPNAGNCAEVSKLYVPTCIWIITPERYRAQHHWYRIVRFLPKDCPNCQISFRLKVLKTIFKKGFFLARQQCGAEVLNYLWGCFRSAFCSLNWISSGQPW